ncbi:DUF4304 domain-containing protein [Flavobacterium sp. LC2016-23]|uniref:DUF4304 domain-containing protein n=1 Tax=Flavobacterium sp. LC2016-23 TaxID=2666330 RepID=UPI0012AFDA74|nr:DUF4304 domain-containing protein [Flavobacterium sp. LC2016-23]MRX42075.1 DUF4304 domain-containing protein [Flavobacterium sp. LC2016-23]
MEKKELSNMLSEVLLPFGFKKKGDYWVLNHDVITKIINLQKSQFNNSFYINYGYVLKSIPLTGMMHIYNRLTSSNIEERNWILELLNLENDISINERSTELKKILLEILISNMQIINTEQDLINELKKRPHLNDVPMNVKEHLNLME